MASRKLNILLIHFNRPVFLKKQLEMLEECKKYDFNIYLSLDGPRIQNKKDSEARKKILKILEEKKHLNIVLKLSESNLGCRYGVEAAIDWFYKNEEKGAVFEDDITITNECLDFFYYWLNKTDSYVISAFSILNTNKPWLSQHGSVWGWACNGKIWKKYRKNSQLLMRIKGVFNFQSLKEFYVLLTWYFQANLKKVDTWDFNWNLYRRGRLILTVMPPNTLVSNIGFGSVGTHTKDKYPEWMLKKQDNVQKVLINDDIRFSSKLEKEYFYRKYSKISYFVILLELLKSIVNKIREVSKIN